MNTFLRTLPLLLLLVSAGCSASNSPEAAARKFWDAMIDENEPAARQLVTKESAAGLTVQRDLSTGDEPPKVRLGESVSKGDHVAVATTLVTMDGNMEQSVPLDTIMVQEDGAWKVDWNRTSQSMFEGAIGEAMKGMEQAVNKMGAEMGKAMQDAMSGMADEMGQVVQETMKEMGDEMGKATTEAMSEMGQELGEAAKEMEEASKAQSAPQPQPQPQPQLPQAQPPAPQSAPVQTPAQ